VDRGIYKWQLRLRGIIAAKACGDERPVTGILVTDVSVINLGTETFVHSAAQTEGATSSTHERGKVRKSRCSVQGGAHTFVPPSIESYAQMGASALQLLNGLAAITADTGKVDKGAFVAFAPWELSVGVCRDNGISFQGLACDCACVWTLFPIKLVTPTSDLIRAVASVMMFSCSC
jgi:hypothetical protein